jgi:hypothetical protein
VQLLDGDALVAEGRPLEHMRVDVPEPVSAGEARLAHERAVADAADHPFPTCFGCGPDRADGDGLQLFAGFVHGRDVCAAPWTPHPSLPNDDGVVDPLIVWAALDCPTYGPVGGQTFQPAVLGTIRVHLRAPVRVDDECVVMSWAIESEGRKHHTAGALLRGGAPIAVGTATWIEVDPDRFR